MPFVPAVNTARVDLQYTDDTEQAQNTIWFEHRAGAITLPDLQALGAAVNDYWITNMMPLLANSLVFVGSVCYDWTTDIGPAVSTPASEAGGIATAPMPNNVAFCISFLTGGRGKSSRGRNFVPGIPRERVELVNRVTAGFATDLVDAYVGILGSAMDADWAWSVVSFFTAGAPRSTALIQPVIGAAASDLVLDSQRRRLPGRGR